MPHRGNLLRSKLKAQGFDIQGVANRMNMHRVTVEKDLKNAELTRKALRKYQSVLDLDIDEFFNSTVEKERQVVKPEPAADLETELKYKDELLAAKEETIQEQRKHIDTLTNMIRFFPNAVQSGIAQA